MLIVGPDPDFAQRQQESWSRAIGIFMSAQENKRQKEREQAQMHLSMLSNHPELAVGEYGDALLKKYARSQPEIASMVVAFRSQAQLKRESDDSLNDYYSMLGRVIGERKAEVNRVAAMPDSFSMNLPPEANPPIPFFGAQPPAISVPNEEKYKRMAQLEMDNDPGNEAMDRLGERAAAARAAMVANKIKQPERVKGLTVKELPEAQRGLLAGGYQVGSPEQRLAARIGAGQEVSPAKIAEAAAKGEADAMKDASREARAEATAKKRELFAIEQQQRSFAHADTLVDRRATRQAEKDAAKNGPWKKGERAKAKVDLDAQLNASEKDGGLKKSTPLVRATIRDLSLQVLDMGIPGITKEIALTKTLESYKKALESERDPAAALAKMRADLERASQR